MFCIIFINPCNVKILHTYVQLQQSKFCILITIIRTQTEHNICHLLELKTIDHKTGNYHWTKQLLWCVGKYNRRLIFTARYSCGKLMFSQASVTHSVHRGGSECGPNPFGGGGWVCGEGGYVQDGLVCAGAGYLLDIGPEGGYVQVALTPNRHRQAVSTRMISMRAVHILLECFLV